MMGLNKRLRQNLKENGLINTLSQLSDYMIANIHPLSRKNKLRWLRLRTGDDEIVREIRGSKMIGKLRQPTPNSFTLANKVVFGLERETGSMKFYSNVLKKHQGDGRNLHVFDIGANIGQYTLLGANILGGSGDIYSIEADPETFDLLKRNVELNQYKNVELLNIAAGSERSTTEFVVRPSSTSNQIKDVSYERETVKTIEVDVRTIDRLISEYDINDDDTVFVKIDAPGYEEYIFQGMNELIQSDRSLYILFGSGGESSANRERIIDKLRTNRFQIEYISYDGGNTIEKLESFDEIEFKSDSTMHFMLSRD